MLNFTIRLFHAWRNGSEKIVGRQIDLSIITVINANGCKISKNFIGRRIRSYSIFIFHNLGQIQRKMIKKKSPFDCNL